MAALFRFPGKLRYHCVVPCDQGGDGVCVASVPCFARSDMCNELIALCEQSRFSAEEEGSSYTQATVDLEVDSAPAVRSWLLERQLVQCVSRCMRATHGVAPAAFDDVFVVKYDATGSGYRCKRDLELHHDGGDVSFMLALSPRSAYCGGGTRFEVFGAGSDFVNDASVEAETVHLEQGELLLFDAGLRHAGRAISSGRRYLLVGFCFTNDPDMAHTAGNVDLMLNKIP